MQLWALTSGFTILLPRSLLAVCTGLRARRLAAALQPGLEDTQRLRSLAPERGAGVQVEALPYSYRPSERTAQALRVLLLELFGNRASVRVAEPLAYGAKLRADPPPAAGADAHATPHRAFSTVVIFNLAQSPEQEVHGVLLAALKRAVEMRSRGSSLLVLLDEDAYRSLGDEVRLGERRQAWQRLARECGLAAVPLGIPAPGSDALLGGARAALWPTAPEAT
jgi:hypothetical protein